MKRRTPPHTLSSTLNRCRRSSIPKRRCRRTRGHPREIRDQPDRRSSRLDRRCGGCARARTAQAETALPPSPLHGRADGVPRRCRAYDRRTDSVTIWSSSQVVHWVRARSRERPGDAGGAHPLCRARCRRRLRAEGSRLPGGSADSVHGAANRSPGAMDRGPPRASDVFLPFARPDPRRRGRLRRRRPYPRVHDDF